VSWTGPRLKTYAVLEAALSVLKLTSLVLPKISKPFAVSQHLGCIMFRLVSMFTVALQLLLLLACGGHSSSSSSGNNGTNQTASIQHVVVVVFENENYADVVGSSSMPYWNSIAQQYSLATQFYANVHPSLPNYLEMTTGSIGGNSPVPDTWSGPYTGATISQALTAAGKTWKMYAESIPSVGYTGGDTGEYVKHHNPFTYFSDVLNNPVQTLNIVPFTQLPTDFGTNSLPNYSFIVPDNIDNGHNCPDGSAPANCPLSARLSQIDNWLKGNLGTLLSNSTFTNNGVIIITFDESGTDNTNGGGRIPVIFAGDPIKLGYQSTTTYQFQSLLRFSLDSLGVTSYPGDAANAPAMNEFLKH
jgi:phosphatidylinositol-3-phosphatase